MDNRTVIDLPSHAHFVTFSCYKNRKLLDHDRCKRIVISALAAQLSRSQGRCLAFVVMPDHVHALVWFPESGRLADFMKQWKRISSYRIKQFIRENLPEYFTHISQKNPVWQRHYYSETIDEDKVAIRKAEYIHNNPIRAGLVPTAEDWWHSSSGYYEKGKSVGVDLAWPDWP